MLGPFSNVEFLISNGHPQLIQTLDIMVLNLNPFVVNILTSVSRKNCYPSWITVSIINVLYLAHVKCNFRTLVEFSTVSVAYSAKSFLI